MANLNRILADIQKEYGRKVARAFADAIADIKNGVDYTAFVRAIESGNIQAALDVLDIDNAVFASMRSSIGEAYSLGGSAVVAATRFNPPTATKAVVRWDAANPVAEYFIRQMVGVEITRVTNDTLDAVRLAMSEGYAKGQGPRTIALDVVGRVGANGKRTGGLVGLTRPQIETARRIEEVLNDPSRYREYFIKDRVTGKMKLRWESTNGNTARTVLAAIKNGKALTPKQIENIKIANNNKALKNRGDAIARTESANAVEQSRIDAFKVGMSKQGIPERYAIKEWLHGGGGMKPREHHVHESGQRVYGLDTPFVMQDLTEIQRPHDPAAPAKHVINCTCSLLIDIDWRQMRLDGVS